MELDWTKPRIIEHQWELNEQTHGFGEFPAFSAVFAPFSSIGCISRSRFTGRSDRLLDILKFARLFRIVQRLVCRMWVLHLGGHTWHCAWGGAHRWHVWKNLGKEPTRSRKCNNPIFYPIELSWWLKNENKLPIASGLVEHSYLVVVDVHRTPIPMVQKVLTCINHHWTSSKQASSPSSRPLKAMRPPKKQRQRTCLPFKKNSSMSINNHQHPQHRQHIWPPHLLWQGG